MNRMDDGGEHAAHTLATGDNSDDLSAMNYMIDGEIEFELRDWSEFLKKSIEKGQAS